MNGERKQSKKKGGNVDNKMSTYYTVRLPKRPVLVNLYVPKDGQLVNVDPDDELADAEDLSAGTQVDLDYDKVLNGTTVCMCAAIAREFMPGLYFVITNEEEPRRLLARVVHGSDLVVVDDAPKADALRREKVRRGKWEKRPLYHLPGSGLWVRSEDGHLRRYIHGHGDPQEGDRIPFSDVQDVAEESEAKLQRPVRVIRDGGVGASYFVECEHGHIGPWGWVVTLRTIDGDDIALGYRTSRGVHLLSDAAEAEATTRLRTGAAQPAPAPGTPLLPLRNANGKRLFGTLTGDVLALKIGDQTHEYAVRWLDSGSQNRVGVVGGTDVLIRLSLSPHPSRAHFEREVRFATEIARMRIGPEIYATLEVGRQRGFVMERLSYTLNDVIECPTLLRKVFVDADGESALVDLYMRASAVIRCVDTKSANVVVRLDPLRLALIDVDPLFCSEQPYASQIPGAFGVTELDEAIGAVGAGLHEQALAAAVSLLVHCTEAARGDQMPFGFVYIRITRCLLKHMETIWPLIEADPRSMGRMRMYNYRKLREGVDPRKLDVMDVLERAISMGHAIELCQDPRDGDLFERSAMAHWLRKTKPPPTPTLEGSQQDLRRKVDAMEAESKLEPTCKLIGCPLHPRPGAGRPRFGRLALWI